MLIVSSICVMIMLCSALDPTRPHKALEISHQTFLWQIYRCVIAIYDDDNDHDTIVLMMLKTTAMPLRVELSLIALSLSPTDRLFHNNSRDAKF